MHLQFKRHNAQRLTLKPSFKSDSTESIYQHEELYVDAIETTNIDLVFGRSIRIFDYQYHLLVLTKTANNKDIERFRWFSQDYLGYDEEKKLVTDIRYSMILIRLHDVGTSH